MNNRRSPGYIPQIDGLNAVVILSVIFSDSRLQSGWPDRFTDIPAELRVKLSLPDDSQKDYAYKNIRKIRRPFNDNSENEVLIIADSQAGDFANMLIENGIDKKVDLKLTL